VSRHVAQSELLKALICNGFFIATVDDGCGGSIVNNGGVGWFFFPSTAALVVGFSSTAVAPRDTVVCSGSSFVSSSWL